MHANVDDAAYVYVCEAALAFAGGGPLKGGILNGSSPCPPGFCGSSPGPAGDEACVLNKDTDDATHGAIASF